MKKSILLVLGVFSSVILSYNNENPQSQYFDNDEDCSNSQDNCCDVDGRNMGISNVTSIVWEVTSGSVTIISRQNTSAAKFEFGSDFTIGTIKASSLVDGALCENSLNIKKNKLI